jgi:hypothetical protein
LAKIFESIIQMVYYSQDLKPDGSSQCGWK